MHTTSFIWIAIAFTGFFSCSNAQPPQSSATAGMENQTTDWVILDKGSQCSIMEPKQVLAKSQAEFYAIWQEAFAGMDMPPSKPSVVFPDYWVIAVFLGEKNKGGYEIDIQSIAQRGETMIITVKEIKPSANCLSTMSIEYPYLLARIPRQSSKNVEFKFVETLRNCD